MSPRPTGDLGGWTRDPDREKETPVSDPGLAKEKARGPRPAPWDREVRLQGRTSDFPVWPDLALPLVPPTNGPRGEGPAASQAARTPSLGSPASLFAGPRRQGGPLPDADASPDTKKSSPSPSQGRLLRVAAATRA